MEDDTYKRQEEYAEGRAEQERLEEINDKGICLHCQDRPQNPAIAGSLCMSCYIGMDGVGCSHSDCPNQSVGDFRQFSYCEIHLIDRIHSAYDAYLAQKSQIEDEEERLLSELSNMKQDPRNATETLSQDESDWHEEWIELKLDKQEMSRTKHMVKSAMSYLDDESLSDPFPDGYNVFG